MANRVSKIAQTGADAAIDASYASESLRDIVRRATRRQLSDMAAILLEHHAQLVDAFQDGATDVLPWRAANSSQVEKGQYIEHESRKYAVAGVGSKQPLPIQQSQHKPLDTLKRAIRDVRGLNLSVRRNGSLEWSEPGESRGSSATASTNDTGESSKPGESQRTSNSDTTSRRKSGDTRAGLIGDTVKRLNSLNKSTDDSTFRRRTADILMDIAEECGITDDGMRNAINRYKAKIAERTLASEPEEQAS